MKKEDRLLRIGVLGCGPISQFAHFDACRKARNAELYAICDVAEDLRSRMAAIHSPRVTYKEFDEMLADKNVEAVIIGVADQFHVPLALKAIAAGKHVLVEKPLAVSIKECAELAAHVKQSKSVLQVGNNRRFDPGVAFAQKFIREELGQMIALKAWYCDSTYRYTMTDNLQPIPLQSAAARKPEGNPKAESAVTFSSRMGVIWSTPRDFSVEASPRCARASPKSFNPIAGSSNSNMPVARWAISTSRFLSRAILRKGSRSTASQAASKETCTSLVPQIEPRGMFLRERRSVSSPIG